MHIHELQEQAYLQAKASGFHDEDATGNGHARLLASLALIHSEVSEAVEDVREAENVMRLQIQQFGEGMPPKPYGFPSELADIIIRTLDLAESMGINMEKAIERKMDYNKSRPRKHGKQI